VKLPATIAVVTNIDPEHMDHYGSADTLHDAFETFIENIPFYGFAVLCIDHPVVQSLIGRIEDRRIITYGLSPQAEVRATNIVSEPEGSRFDVVLTYRRQGAEHTIQDLSLPMLAQHNVQNALAAVAIAGALDLDEPVIRKGLADFAGVKRRFTKTGEAGGVTVIDDYGHHPVEIAAVLNAARQATEGKVVAVVQPHRYSRLANLFEGFCNCFNDADQVIVTEVYPAGESPIEGVSRDALVEGLRAHGHRHAQPLDSEQDLPRMIRELTAPGDMVVCLGAGNITAWANALPRQLVELSNAGDSKSAGAKP
jgi:UDP-N-acetylmuramate--alanine ligase